MPKQNILFIDPADFIGGAEKAALDIIKYGYLKNGHNVQVVTTNPSFYKEKIGPNVPVTHLYLPPLHLKRFIHTPWHLIKALWKLKKIVKTAKITHIHTNTIRSHVIGSLLHLITGIPLSWTVHDCTFPTKIIRWCAQFPRHIFYVSQVVRVNIESKIKAEHAHKLSFLPNIISADLFTIKASNQLKTQYCLPSDTPLIGLVGRIDWWKGQDVFINIAQAVLKQIPQAQFFIIGDANQHDESTYVYKHKCIKQIKKLGLSDNIHITGHISNIHPIIKSLSVLVHTSVIPEPFGRTIIEAMALQVPVVASNLGGPQESVQSDQTGILCNPHDINAYRDAIINLIQNQKLRSKLSNNAFQVVKKHYSATVLVNILSTKFN